MESRLGVALDDAAGSVLIPSLVQGQGISQTLAGFRYRVRFLPTPTWPDQVYRDNHPVLECPWFDDITFAWQGAGGPRVLTWE